MTTAHPSPLDMPALDGRPVTEGHARYCLENGHAKHTHDGIDTGRCPRCGDLTEVQRDETPEGLATLINDTKLDLTRPLLQVPALAVLLRARDRDDLAQLTEAALRRYRRTMRAQTGHGLDGIGAAGDDLRLSLAAIAAHVLDQAEAAKAAHPAYLPPITYAGQTVGQVTEVCETPDGLVFTGELTAEGARVVGGRTLDGWSVA